MIKKINEILLVALVSLLVYALVSSTKSHASLYFNKNQSQSPTSSYSYHLSPKIADNKLNHHLSFNTVKIPDTNIVDPFYIINPQNDAYSSSSHQVKAPANINEKLLIEKLAKKYKKPSVYIENIWQRVLTETHKSKVDIDPLLVIALIEQESSFNNNARSHANARGLTQVISKWHQDKLNPGDNLYDVDVSVRVGVKVLEEYMIIEKGNLKRALQRYNGSLSDPSARYANRVFAKHRNLQQSVLTG